MRKVDHAARIAVFAAFAWAWSGFGLAFTEAVKTAGSLSEPRHMTAVVIMNACLGGCWLLSSSAAVTVLDPIIRRSVGSRAVNASSARTNLAA